MLDPCHWSFLASSWVFELRRGALNDSSLRASPCESSSRIRCQGLGSKSSPTLLRSRLPPAADLLHSLSVWTNSLACCRLPAVLPSRNGCVLSNENKTLFSASRTVLGSWLLLASSTNRTRPRCSLHPHIGHSWGMFTPTSSSSASATRAAPPPSESSRIAGWIATCPLHCGCFGSVPTALAHIPGHPGVASYLRMPTSFLMHTFLTSGTGWPPSGGGITLSALSAGTTSTHSSGTSLKALPDMTPKGVPIAQPGAPVPAPKIPRKIPLNIHFLSQFCS